MAALGGWDNPQAPDLFARFTETALRVLAEGVELVCTINEPNMIAYTPGVNRPPGQFIAEQVVRAHQRSRKVLSAITGIKSGWTVATQAFQAEPGCEQITRDCGHPREDFFLEAARGDDFVGVQAYTRNLIDRALFRLGKCDPFFRARRMDCALGAEWRLEWGT